LIAVSALAIDKTIEESYAKIQAATLKKDTKALKTIWETYADPSCVAILDGKNKINFKQMSKLMDQQLKMVKKFNSCKIRILSSKQKGDLIICNVENTQSFVMDLNGTDSLFAGTSIVEDTWKKINGKYKLVAIKTIKENFKQDGKPIKS
jgi:hypothetical protein